MRMADPGFDHHEEVHGGGLDHPAPPPSIETPLPEGDATDSVIQAAKLFTTPPEQRPVGSSMCGSDCLAATAGGSTGTVAARG